MARLLCAALTAAFAAAAPLPATYLRVNYLVDPTLSDANPTFSWLPDSTDRGATQSAFQIVVTSLDGKVAWDSGKVASVVTAGVQAPTPFAADRKFSWIVSYWDGAGVAAGPSAPATFGTPPGDEAAWTASGAQWIGCTGVGGPNAHQMRLDFTLPAGTITSARLYVSGLGWHIGFLNGARLGDAVLEPAFTNLRTRVLYVAHDVTTQLHAGGANAFAALLGGGWTDVLVPWGPNNATGVPPWNGSATHAIEGTTRGPTRGDMMSLTQEDLDALIAGGLGHGHTGYERRLRMWLAVHWSDGTTSTIVSSASDMGRRASGGAPDASAAAWQCGSGALIAADLYGGCEIDARLETTGWTDVGYAFANGSWADAVRIAAPGGVMSPAVFPPVRIITEFEPLAMWVTPNGSFVFDLGQNAPGGVRLTLPGPTVAGVRIIVRHAEAVMHPPYGAQDGTLYYGNLRSAEATDTYTTKGSDDGEVFEPLFTWHGFRYVEVRGLPMTPTLTGVVRGIHYRTDVTTTGALAFPASANVLNQLSHAIEWGQASNLMGNPSDCPQRDERLGWTGDSALTNEESTFYYDMSAFYTHWAHTLDDSLVKNDEDPTFKAGSLPDTVPDITGGYNSDASWSSVWPSTLYSLYKAYGQLSRVTEFWPGVLAYVNHTVAGIDAHGDAFHQFGDWCPPPEKEGGGQGPKPTPAFTATATFLDDLTHIIEMGKAILSPDVPALEATRKQVLARWVKNYFVQSAYFGTSPTDGAQSAQAIALAIGAVPADSTQTIVDYLVADIAKHGGALSVGIIGQKYFTRQLTAHGNAWLAANISMQVEYPSYGWTFNHPIEPATTLWELWDGPSEGPGMNSRNHIMQGAIGAWLFTDVLGLSQQPNTFAYSSLLIWPRVTVHENLPSASGSYDSLRGAINIAWANETTAFSLTVTVPMNAVAEVRLPFPTGVSSTLSATEGGVAIYGGGRYKPGVAGVTGAAVDAPSNTLAVLVGSGTYVFAATW